jgi:hypothetical protein
MAAKAVLAAVVGSEPLVVLVVRLGTLTLIAPPQPPATATSFLPPVSGFLRFSPSPLAVPPSPPTNKPEIRTRGEIPDDEDEASALADDKTLF